LTLAQAASGTAPPHRRRSPVFQGGLADLPGRSPGGRGSARGRREGPVRAVPGDGPGGVIRGDPPGPRGLRAG